MTKKKPFLKHLLLPSLVETSDNVCSVPWLTSLAVEHYTGTGNMWSRLMMKTSHKRRNDPIKWPNRPL
jgi:hypothetical protein